MHGDPSSVARHWLIAFATAAIVASSGAAAAADASTAPSAAAQRPRDTVTVTCDAKGADAGAGVAARNLSAAESALDATEAFCNESGKAESAALAVDGFEKELSVAIDRLACVQQLEESTSDERKQAGYDLQRAASLRARLALEQARIDLRRAAADANGALAADAGADAPIEHGLSPPVDPRTRRAIELVKCLSQLPDAVVRGFAFLLA